MMHLILMRGVPSSGKSTLAQNILAEHMKTTGNSGVILSTDQQFMRNGVYCFELQRLGEAHSKNQQLAAEAMKQKVGLVIIDNTNLSEKERKPYIDFAKQFGYTYSVQDVTTSWARNAEECAKRNTHNVPVQVIERMLQKLERDLNGSYSTH